MRQLFFIIAFLLFYINSSSQTSSTKDYIKIENTIPIKEFMYNMEKQSSYQSSGLMSYYNNDTLFFFLADYSSSDSIRMFAYSHNTNTYSYKNFDVSELINNEGQSSYNISSFAVSKDYLVIASSSKGSFLYVFNKLGERYVYNSKIPYAGNLFSNGIYFLPNGKLLGVKNYVYYREAPNQSSKLSILNLETKTIEKTINTEFLLPLYTLMAPYNIVSVNDKSILFSQRGDYEIAEYDFELNHIGNIENKEIQWNRMPQKDSDSIYNTCKFANQMIPYMMRNMDKYNCINNIYSSKDKLFVFYNKKGSTEKNYYDIWAKDNGAWVLLKKDISDVTKSIRHVDKRSLTSMGRNLHCLGDKFLRIGFHLPDLGNYPRFIYMIKAQKYFMENDLPYSIEIINFKI